MPKRLLSKLTVAAAVAGTLVGALPAEAGPPCSSACGHTLRVGDRPVRWVSRQTFRHDAAVEITLRANGRELDADPIRDCAARFYGEGVVAKVNSCGKPRAPIRVRAVSVERKPAKLRIRYRSG